MDSLLHNNELLFFLNGNKVVVKNPNPEHNLLTYLRSNHVGLTGTKLGCGEGGCGACTVMLSHYSAKDQTIVHRAVNSCLYPLCGVAGCAITTIEGLGNVTDGLHPVQQRISDLMGSQCGFCTPGIVMALYSYLRSHPGATPHDIEESFDGNLCRCTGYRPILDAARSFGTVPSLEGEVELDRIPSIALSPKVDEANSTNKGIMICPTTGKPCGCKTNSTHIPSKPLDLKQELIFPPYLINDQKEKSDQMMVFKGDRATWYTPATFKQLLELKNQYNNAKIIVGNTEVGIETKFRNIVYPVLISPVQVDELNRINKSEDGIHVGAAVTLTEIKNYLVQLCKQEDLVKENKTQVFKAILAQLRWFAGNQIRNAACLGGNIITASPISDVNPVLLACNAVLELVGLGGEDGKTEVTRHVKITEFFKSYRVTAIQPNEVLKSIFIPYSRPLEFVEAYKQSRRRDDDIAIVSCCFRVLLEQQQQDSFTVKDISLAYGGMNVKAVLSPSTQAMLIGKQWSRDMLDQVYQHLEVDLPLAQGAPGGMIEYRRSLTTSFFFKFFLLVSSKLFDLTASQQYKVDEREQSSIKPYDRPVSSGEQQYQSQPVLHPVSQPIKHQSADKQVTGEAVYTDDIKIPSLYAAMIVSSKAHAYVKKVDATRALTMPGVRGFYTAADIKGKNQVGPIIDDEECLVTKEALCQGHQIAIIVAETHQQALEASKAVVVEYEELPAILTIEDAIAKNSYHPIIHRITDGIPVEEALKNSEHVIEGEFKMGGQEHFYLETNATLVVPVEGNEFIVYASTQNPTKTQILVAKVLGVPANQIVCKLKRMGGGFGGKETRSIFGSAICAVASQNLKQPVRLLFDRDTDMITTGGRHPFIGRYRIGFTSEGKIQAAQVKLYADGGYSLDLSGGVVDRALFHSENAYKIPSVDVEGFICKTNLPSNTAFRGFGGPQGMMICENWVERIAQIVNLPVHQVRQANFYKEGDYTHYKQLVNNCQLQRIWEETMTKSNYLQRVQEVKEFNQQNKWKKRGVCLLPTKFGMSFTIKTLNQAGALVHVYTDGSVLVTHGGTEMGQGLHTKMVQIASQSLGVDVEKVYISETSTDKVANTTPTAASVSSDMNGMAVLDACNQINERLAPLKARFPQFTFAQLANQAFVERINLSANGFYATPNIGYIFRDNGIGEGTPFNYFNYGCACSLVEIDTLTGDFTILQSDIIMDVGNSLNPTIDIGQVEGAFTQGVGLTTMEEIVTFTPSGYQFTRGPSTYKIPGFNDVPIVFNVSLLSDAPNPKAIHSSKGVGEPPLFLGASVFFAIRNAIHYARLEQQPSSNEPVKENGWFDLQSPATCERIRNACIDRFTLQFSKK